MNERTKHFTNKEFDALERNSEGRILGDFPMLSCWFTCSQIQRLQSDDHSYYQDCAEENRVMLAEFMKYEM